MDTLLLLAQLTSFVFMGDSLSVGMRPYLAPELAVNVVGASTFDSWAWTLSQVKPGQTVVIVLGTNDVPGLSRFGAEDYRHRVGEVARTFHQKTGKPIVWAGPPCSPNTWWDTQLSTIDTELRLALKGVPHTYISLRNATLVDGKCPWLGRAGDGIHFTPNGYYQLSRAMAINP